MVPLSASAETSSPSLPTIQKAGREDGKSGASSQVINNVGNLWIKKFQPPYRPINPHFE